MKAAINKARAKQQKAVKRKREISEERQTRKQRRKSSDSVRSSGSSEMSGISSQDESEISIGMIGMLFDDKYLVLKYIACGTYGRIWLAYDARNNRFVVLKFQYPNYYKEAVEERDIMLAVGENKYLMSYIDSFDQIGEDNKKYFCLVFELLGPDLYMILKNKTPAPLYVVKQIIHELLQGLAHMHAKGYMHTDLKPENLLLIKPSDEIQGVLDWFSSLKPSEIYEKCLENSLPPDYESLDRDKRKKARTRARVQAAKALQSALFKPIVLEISKSWKLDDSDSDSEETPTAEAPTRQDIQITSVNGQYCKLADFGNTFKILDNPEALQTRQFRAPETIILTEVINEKIDIWSVGCIAYELLTQTPLFDIHTTGKTDDQVDREHLEMMYKYLGKMPMEFLDQSCIFETFFDNRGRLKERKTSHKTKKIEPMPLIQILQEKFNDENSRLNQFRGNELELANFYQFLMKCFRYNPKYRPSARELLQDEWFNVVNSIRG